MATATRAFAPAPRVPAPAGGIFRCGPCRMPSTAVLIQVNRALAWAIVVSPAVQIATGANFARGLLFDLLLVVAHGLLSVKLFGMPRLDGQSRRRVPTRFGARHILLRVTGIGRAGPSPRNALLLGGYRILLGLAYFAAIVGVQLTGPWWPVDLAPWVTLPLTALGLYAMVRFPFSSLGHVFTATGYAARRGATRHWPRLMAWLVTAAFVLTSFWNLIR